MLRDCVCQQKREWKLSQWFIKLSHTNTWKKWVQSIRAVSKIFAFLAICWMAMLQEERILHEYIIWNFVIPISNNLTYLFGCSGLCLSLTLCFLCVCICEQLHGQALWWLCHFTKLCSSVATYCFESTLRPRSVTMYTVVYTCPPSLYSTKVWAHVNCCQVLCCLRATTPTILP